MEVSASREVVVKIATAELDERVFAETVSKDELPVPATRGTSTFVKHCADEATARAEFLALEALSSRQPEPLAPLPIGVEGATVTMELVHGIRAFELLRELPSLQEAGVVPTGAAGLMLDRLLSHLAAAQPLVARAAEHWSTRPYPFDEKARLLLELLGRRLDLPPPTPAYHAQMLRLEKMWNEAVSLPFLDTVAKNIIVVDGRLSPQQLSRDERMEQLGRILGEEPQWLAEAPILEVDFASVGQLTTLEDDWVSLQLHEVTAGLRPTLATLTLPAGADRGRRLALTIFMRYLRFGGRKMAYALMHPAGFAARFNGHDAGFYFRRLPQLVAEADAALVQECPAVFGRIEQLSRAFDALELPSVANDPWFGTKHLWRESPLERGPQ